MKKKKKKKKREREREKKKKNMKKNLIYWLSKQFCFETQQHL